MRIGKRQEALMQKEE